MAKRKPRRNRAKSKCIRCVEVLKRPRRKRRVTKEKQAPLPSMVTQTLSVSGWGSAGRFYQPEITMRPQQPIANMEVKKERQTITLDTKDTIKEFLEKKQQPQNVENVMTENPDPNPNPNPDPNPNPARRELTYEEKLEDLRDTAETLYSTLKSKGIINRKGQKPKFSRWTDPAKLENKINLYQNQLDAFMRPSMPRNTPNKQTPTTPQQIMINRPVPDNPFTKKVNVRILEDDEEEDSNDNMLS